MCVRNGLQRVKGAFILLDQNQHMHGLGYLDPEALLASDISILKDK